MSLLSTRKTFKILGILSAIIGVIVIIYAIFFVQTFSFHIQAGPDPALGEVSGETPFQKLVVGFVGALMIFIGYKSYKYIPYAEREREQISELELDK